MYIDPQWLKYLRKFKDITINKYKYRLKGSKESISFKEYNSLITDRLLALDYITMLCHDVENILIENAELTKKLAMVEEYLIEKGVDL